jgi:hypothetical protein
VAALKYYPNTPLRKSPQFPIDMLLLQLRQGKMCDCVCMIRILLTTPSIVASLITLVRHHFQCTRGSLISRPRVPHEILDCTTCKMERKHTHTHTRECSKQSSSCVRHVYILTMLRKANIMSYGTCPRTASNRSTC